MCKLTGANVESIFPEFGGWSGKTGRRSSMGPLPLLIRLKLNFRELILDVLLDLELIFVWFSLTLYCHILSGLNFVTFVCKGC